MSPRSKRGIVCAACVAVLETEAVGSTMAVRRNR